MRDQILQDLKQEVTSNDLSVKNGFAYLIFFGHLSDELDRFN
jgi:hypothetical protein